MLSATLESGLKGYAIGEKLRALRLRRKMGLVQLGQHTQLSPALLSKIERGKLVPTLPTLLRIAMVFSVGLEHFFTEDRQRPVVAIVRQKDRQRFPERPDGRDVSFHFESLDYPATERKLNAYYAEFEPLPPERAKAHSHSGVEFLYILQGRLGLRVGEQENELEGGDSVYFDASVPHAYRRIGSTPCAAVVVTVP